MLEDSFLEYCPTTKKLSREWDSAQAERCTNAHSPQNNNKSMFLYITNNQSENNFSFKII